MDEEKKAPTQSEIDAENEGRETGDMGFAGQYNEAEKASRARGVEKKNDADVQRQEDEDADKKKESEKKDE